MKSTIEQVELQAAQELEAAFRSFLQRHYPVPQSRRLTVSFLDSNGRKKRRSASSDNWSLDTDEIRIRFEPAEDVIQQPMRSSGHREADRPVAATADRSGTASSDPMSDLVRALSLAEHRPGFDFVSLKWFRDAALPAGYAWAKTESTRHEMLRDAIARRLVLTSKVQNPKDPQFPVTAIRLNRLLPEVQTILGTNHEVDADFHPVEIGGEPMSTTIIRERRQ
ncbi:MAG: hypothetical protein ABSA78_04225 [Candidatus Sulfotelmatobacter sp.]|jgi:hypothetical protein